MNTANLYDVLHRVALTTSCTKVLIFVGKPLEDSGFQAALVAKLLVEYDYELNLKGFQGDTLHPDSFEGWVKSLALEAEDYKPIVIFTHRYDVISVLSETVLQKFSSKLIRFRIDTDDRLLIDAEIPGTKLHRMINLDMEVR